MKVGGLQKFSTLDYPGKLSAVIFCQGCPLKCVYCHNQDLQNFATAEQISFAEVIEFLKSRVGLLDAVVFSGGEPLSQSDLQDAISEVKKLGFLIGLHTSGIVPQRFEEIISLVDWIGFDIKTVFSDYEKITQVRGSGQLAEKSFLIMLEQHSNFEIRTTVDTRLISENDLIEIAKTLADNKISEWILQECILRDQTPVQKLPLPDQNIIEKISKYVAVKIRRQ